MRQVLNLADLPFADHHVALMPDAHGGYGMPIGGVLATVGYVVPNAIGVDIGCGMNARRTNIRAEIMQDSYPGQGTVIKAILGKIQRNVPTGNGPQGNRSDDLAIPDEFLREGARLGMPAANDPQILLEASQGGSAARQCGTLGGGNHFLELDVDEEGFVWIMLHSGSRAFGKRICDHFNKIARDINEAYFRVLS